MKKLNLKRKTTRWIWMMLVEAHKPLDKLHNLLNNNNKTPKPRFRQGNRTMMKMATTIRMFQAHIIQLNMPICKFSQKSRNCLSIFKDTNHRKLIWKQSWSHSYRTTCQQLVRSTPASKCLNQTDKKKIWVLLNWMSQRLIVKIKLFWSWNTSKVKMSCEQLQWQLIQ